MAGKSQTHTEPVDLIYLLLAVLSLILNGMMLYITCRRRNQWAIDVTLLLMIGLSDLLAGVVVAVLQLWKFNTSYSAVYPGSPWCDASAVLSQATLLTTITLTALLAFVRYLAIVRGKSVCNLTWTLASSFLIGVCWTFSVVRELSSDSILIPSGLDCSSTNAPNTAALYIMSLPTIAIPVCYSLLASHFWEIMRQKHFGEIPRRFRMRFNGLAVVVILYITAVFPEYILRILIYTFKVDVPTWLISVGRICTFNLTILNAVFALTYHEDINHELLRLIDQFDLRSNELPSQPSYSRDRFPKRDPKRTSTFLYFQ